MQRRFNCKKVQQLVSDLSYVLQLEQWSFVICRQSLILEILGSTFHNCLVSRPVVTNNNKLKNKIIEMMWNETL